MTEAKAIQELRRYIAEDINYRKHTKFKSDFDKFCETHIKSIEVVLEALQDKNKKLEDVYTQISNTNSNMEKHMKNRKVAIRRLNLLKNDKEIPCNIFNRIEKIINLLEVQK